MSSKRKTRKSNHSAHPAPPIRHCTRCRKRLTRKRVMNKSFFCSTAHRDADLRERKNYRASKDCRLCGRPAKLQPQ